jgi:hypothetical protein
MLRSSHLRVVAPLHRPAGAPDASGGVTAKRFKLGEVAAGAGAGAGASTAPKALSKDALIKRSDPGRPAGVAAEAKLNPRPVGMVCGCLNRGHWARGVSHYV